MLLRLGRRCRRFESCHSDQKAQGGGNAPLWTFSIEFDGEDPLLFAEKDRFALR